MTSSLHGGWGAEYVRRGPIVKYRELLAEQSDLVPMGTDRALTLNKNYGIPMEINLIEFQCMPSFWCTVQWPQNGSADGTVTDAAVGADDLELLLQHVNIPKYLL